MNRQVTDYEDPKSRKKSALILSAGWEYALAGTSKIKSAGAAMGVKAGPAGRWTDESPKKTVG